MSSAFSRRSFLKYSAVAAVAVAGASLFTGCESTGDSYNLVRDGAGTLTILQIQTDLGTYSDKDKKFVLDAPKVPNLLLKGERKYAIGFISIFTNYYTLIIYKTKKGMNYFAVCTK